MIRTTTPEENTNVRSDKRKVVIKNIAMGKDWYVGSVYHEVGSECHGT